MDQALALNEAKTPLYIINAVNGKRDWTPFGIKTILGYYLEKKSIKEIANLCDTNKNSVVGVLNRARKRGELPRIENSPTRGILKPRPPKPVPKIDPETLRVIAMVKEKRKAKFQEHKIRLRLIKDAKEVTLVERKPHQCLWPIGDPRLSDFRFCGKIRLASCSYCPEHAKIAYRPSRGRGDY